MTKFSQVSELSMQVFPYIYKRTVSSILITTIMLSQVIILDPIVEAAEATRDTMGLVTILVAEELLKDAKEDGGLTGDTTAGTMNADISRILADGSLSSDLNTLGVTNIANNLPKTVGGRILRYADDIQRQLQNTKVMIVPVPSMDNPEKPWRIQEVLDRLYTEGDITDNKIAKLQGVVMIGDIPLPLVTKDTRTFLSVYPYTDFEDPAYYYDHERDQFIYNELSGALKAEVWHGVIRYPVSWQQYVLDTKHSEELSDAKMKDTTNTEYNKVLEKMRGEFMDAQRKELATYFDKNHSYYIGGEYSEFSKKAIQMDLFRELGQVTQSSLQGYQEFIENWDNISYMRYTKKWLTELTDKFYPKTKQKLQDTGKVPTDNANIKDSDPTKKDVFATAKDLSGKFEDSEGNTQNLIPDIFTKDPIEKFLSRSTDVFGFLTNSYAAYFNGSGRWDFFGQLKGADGTSLFKIIAQLDQDAQKNIRSVNDSMEKVMDQMLDKYQNDKNLMIDIPSGEVNYFGKFLKTIRATRPHPYIDVDPSPEWSNNYLGNVGTSKIAFTKDKIDTSAKDLKDASRNRYIPFTGQDFDEVKVHIEGDAKADYKLQGYSGYFGGSIKGGSRTEPTVYYNPNATQEKYIEYVDDIKAPVPFFELRAIWDTVWSGKISGETIENSTYKPYRKAVLHLVNKPFTAEDCTIFVGGAPEGGLFVRGEESVGDPSVEGWNDPIYEGRPGGSGWRNEKVDAQVAFDITPLQVQIDTMKATPVKDSTGNPPPCPSNSQRHNWDIREKEIQKDEKKLESENQWLKFYNVSVNPVEQANDVANAKYEIARARAMLNYDRSVACAKGDTTPAQNSRDNAIKNADTQRKSDIPAEILSWEQYMSSGERGDAARLKDFIEYAKRLPQTTAQTVEANKLYNIASDAYMEYGKDDGSELKKRPEAEYYETLYPDNTGLGLGKNSGGYKSGYFGDCTAPNLKFTDDGDAVPPDASVEKGMLTATIEAVRGQKTALTNKIGGFIKGFLSLGQADKLEKGGLQQGILLRMKTAPADVRWESGNEIDRVVAILRKVENPEEKVKTFEEFLDFAVAAAALDAIQKPGYNPDPKSSDPLDKLVAVYRTLPESAEESKYNMLLSIVQLAVSQSKFDPEDDANKKHDCQPMKALVPIKDTAGSKSVESPSYEPLKATKVITRENRTTPVPQNFIMGPSSSDGVMAPQMQITAEKFAGSTNSKMNAKDLAAALIAININLGSIEANFKSQYLSLLSQKVRAFFSGSVFDSAPQNGIETQSTKGQDVAPYRDQIKAQNRYSITPVEEEVKAETSYQACLLYADYGMPLSAAQEAVRKMLVTDVNRLQNTSSAYIEGHYGAREQLPPALVPDKREWLIVTKGADPIVTTNYVGTMKQVPNGEEKLGLDKKESIVSIIKHKEPTNETIAKQLKNSTSFDLPVDSPRYVDMFHYDPIPQWGSVGEQTPSTDADGNSIMKTTYKAVIKKWTEYYEHLRFPYLDWFNVFEKEKRFAYVTEDSRSTVDKTITEITLETRKIARHFQQYLNDYVAQTSLQGGAANGKNTLKDIFFDYDKALKESEIVKDITDDKKKVSVAEQRLSFAIYWQHLPLSEKYKYVLHNYLSSDKSLSQGDTPKVVPSYFGDKTGFEAGTIIADSAFPHAVPLGLENLTYTKEQKPQITMPDPIAVKVEDPNDIVTSCKKGSSYNQTGVPLFEWPGAIINCWLPSITPPITFPNNNEKYETFAKRISEAGQDVVTRGSNLLDDFKKFENSVKAFGETAGKVAESVGNTFQDIDGDGLPMVGAPSDNNVFLSDSKTRVITNGTAQIIDGSNGFKDVQDYVDKVTFKVSGKDNIKKTILSTKSIEPLKVQAQLRTRDGQILEGNSFDYIQIELDEQANRMVTMSSAEKIQKAEKGSATFNIFPTFGANGIEGKVRFHVVRQKTSNSDQPFERLTPDLVSDWLTLKSTSDSLSVAYLYSPTKDNGKKSFSEGAIFTTDDKIHTLSIAAVDTNGNILEKKAGKVSIEYKKENTDTGEFEPYNDTKLTSRINIGKNAVPLSIPSEAGKYLVEITPEDALELPPVKTTFLVVESKIASVDMKVNPSVLIEGGTTHITLSFLDSQKKEVPISDQLAQFVIPTNPAIPLNIQSGDKLDGYPGNKTTTENPIDFMVGKVNQITMTAGEMPEGAPDFVDIIPLRLQISDTIKKSASLRVYKKGSLQAKATIRNAKPSYSVTEDAPITADIAITDKSGSAVPYNGTIRISYADQGYFEKVEETIEIKDGKGVVTFTPSHKAGETNITVTDQQESFSPQNITLKFTAGPLSKVHFTSQVERPLEPKTEDSKLGKNLTEMMLEYQGEDAYGNVIETNDPVLFELSPFEGLDFYDVKSDGSDGEKLTVFPSGSKKFYGQTLTNGKARVKVKSTMFTGEVTIVLSGQAKDTISKDSVRIPVRFTLYKEFIQRLRPNILYTNLLGGNYGDVTKKDFMAGWWLLSGKSQAVTASTISSHEDPVSVRVQPNGAIDIPQGDGVSTNKAVVPIYNQGEPFQLEIREQDTNKALMRVRYNIAPLPVKEITSESQIQTVPGIYLRKSANTKISRNDASKQSVITYDGKELGVLGDNLQFLPTGLPPEIDVNTDRKDLLEMTMKTPDGTDVMDMYVVLAQENIYETSKGFKSDIEAAKSKKESQNYEAQASTGKTGIQFSESLKKTTEILASKNIITPVEDKDRYVNKVIVSRSELDQYKGGTFLEASTSPLYTILGGNVVLAGVDTILNPNNVPASIAAANTAANQKSQPVIKVQASSGGILSTYALQDLNRSNKTRDLISMQQIFRAKNIKVGILSNTVEPGLFADMQFANSVKIPEKVDTDVLADRIRIKKTFVTIIPESKNGEVIIPARTESETVTAAEIYPDGSYLINDIRFDVKRSFAANVVKYSIVEKSSNKILGNSVLVLDPSSLRVLPYSEGTSLLYSSKEQGVYIEIKDTGSSFDEVTREIKKANDLILSLLPEHFLEVVQPSYVLTVKDPTQTNLNTKNPLVLQLRNTSSVLIADLYIQLAESPLEFTASTQDAVPAEELKGTVSTTLPVEETAGEVRIKNTDGSVLWAFEESTFENRILPPASWNIVPEQVGPDMNVYSLRQGTTVMAKVSFKLSARFTGNKEVTNIAYKAPGTYLKKIDPYVVWNRDVAGAITGFNLKEFNAAFSVAKPPEFVAKVLELTSRNLYSASYKYQENHSQMNLVLSDKSNLSQKKTLLELQGSYSPQVLPMKLYNGENTTGIYFAGNEVKNAVLAEGYTLERRIDGQDRVYWKVKRNEEGNISEEKNIAKVTRDGSVVLNDAAYSWKISYTQGNYSASLYEKSTGTLLDSISILLKPGTITRVLPYKNEEISLYNPSYQGVYADILDSNYYLDQNAFSIRKKNVNLDEIVSFKKDTFFIINANQNFNLVPETNELTQTGKILPPILGLVDNATAQKVANIYMSLNENAPQISIKQDPAQTERSAKENRTAVLSTFSNTISVKDNDTELQIIQKTDALEQVLWTISKQDVSQGTLTENLADIKVSALSQNGLYLTLLPKGETDETKAFAVLSYKNDNRYTPLRYIGKNTIGEAIQRPGVYIRVADPLVSLSADPVLFTQSVYFGYDEAFVLGANGVLQSKNPNIFTINTALTQPLPSTALYLSMNAFNVDIAHEFYKFSNLAFSTTKIPERLTVKGTDAILPSSGNVLTLINHKEWGSLQKGVEIITDTLGHVVSAALDGTPVAQWTSTLAPTLLEKTKLSYDPSIVKGMGFTLLKENGEKLLTYIITPNFVEKATLTTTTSGTTESTSVSTDPVRAAAQIADKTFTDTQEALTLLDGHGVFVEKRVNDNWFSIGYEATGESTNNPYALVLKDQTLSTSKTATAGNTGIGVEDALTDSGSGAGWTGDFKNMLLFAAGNSVGKSTLPHMSEALINIGDPVISLKIEPTDNRTNDMFTNDVGEFIMEHAHAGINTIKVFDIDSDGRKDILFAEKTGKIFGIKNMGGNPVMWKYTGEIFDVPDGIKKLLVTKLDNDDKLDLMVSTGKDNIIATRNESNTAMSYADGSIVSLINLGNGMYQRGVNAIKELGKVDDMQMGDFDGNGTDDLFAITDKKELKVVLIAPTLPDGSKTPYKVITLDTLGVNMSNRELGAEDVYIRFQNTKLYDQSEAPKAMPTSPDVVFVPNIEGQGVTNANSFSNEDPGKKGYESFLSGTQGTFSSVDGLRNQMVKMLVSSEQPYIRSGGAKTAALDDILFRLKKTDPFAFMNEGIIGVLNPVNNIQQAIITNEITSTPTQFAVSKRGTDLNGNKIRKGDKIKYEIAASTTLPEIKGFDLADRTPLSMDLLPGSITCELQENGKTAWKVLSLADECTLSGIGGGNLFSLYFKNLSLKNGDKLRITYQMEVAEEPVEYHLNLLGYRDAAAAMAATAGININSGLSAIGADLAIGDKAKRMGANITSDTFGGKGSFYYRYQESNPLFEKQFIKDKTQKPGEGNPIMDQLAKLMGYEYDDDGNLIQKDPDKKPDENAVKDFAKGLGKTLQTATSTDKDEDGIPDLWDNEIVVKPEYKNAAVVKAGDIDIAGAVTGGVSQLAQGASTALDQVNKRLSENNCYFGGCGLFPKNKAFLVPGKSELFEGPDIPVFAFPTPTGLVPVWPPDGTYFNSKSLSQIRVYFSVTLSARMAMAVCVGPFDFGMADTSALVGVVTPLPNANCYPFILPDVFDLVKLCQSLESALTGVVTAATEMIGGGAYAAARVKKRGIAEAGAEPDGAFIAYHYEFNDPALTPSYMEQFATLAKNSSAPNTSYNKHAGGFPKIPMDWVERQMEELLKLLKIPTIYIRLPDPRSLIGNVIKGAATMSENALKPDPTAAEKAALEAKTKNDTRATLESKAKSLGIVDENVPDGALKTLVLNEEKKDALQEVNSMDLATLRRRAAELNISGSTTLKEDALRTQVINKTYIEVETEINAKNRANLLTIAKEELLLLSSSATDDQIRSMIAAKEQQAIAATRERCLARMDQKAQTRTDTNNQTVQNIDDLISKTAEGLSSAKDYVNTTLNNVQGDINCEGDFIGQQMQNVLQDASWYTELSGQVSDPSLVNSFLMKQKGIGDALDFLSKIPLVNITHEEVVFEYPWIAPEKFFEIKQNIQYAMDQSIENFQNFYKANADCFFDDPKAYNTISEPNFSIIPRMQASGTPRVPTIDTNGSVSTGADISIRCLAVARVGSDAWVNIQGLQKNLERLNQYANIQVKFKKYVQWKSYTVGRLVETTTGVIDFLSGYITRQQKIINNWKKAIYQIKNYSKTFQIVVDVFQNYRNSCADCVNDKGSALASTLDALGNIIPDIPVIRVPRWPDIVVDFSNVRAQMRITIPDIKLRPVDFQIPKLSPITFPNISLESSISQQDLSLMMKNGINVRFPVLPALPDLPDLPEFPQLDLPKLADLPPPPIIPKLDATITTTIQILDKILQNICLVRKNLIPIPEWQLASQIEKLTRGTTLFKIKENKSSDIVLPGIDQIKISGYINLVNKKPYTALTDLVKTTAEQWNKMVTGNVQSFVSGIVTTASEATSKVLSDAAASFKDEDGRSALDRLSQGINSAVETTNGALSSARNSVQQVSDDLADTMSNSIQISDTGSTGDAIAETLNEDQLKENMQVAAVMQSPDVQNLFVQMDALKSLMENVSTADGISFDNYIPSLKAQIELLKTSGDTLGEARHIAIEKIENIIALAEKEGKALEVDEPVSSDSFQGIRNWKATRNNLETLHKDLEQAQYSINNMSSVNTMEDFRSVLADAGMLADSFANTITASTDLSLQTPEERNNEQQKNLEVILQNAAAIVPIDYREMMAPEIEESQKVISDTYDIPEAGVRTSDITPITASTSDGTLIAAATTTSSSTTTTASTAKEDTPPDPSSSETASNLLVQLTDLPGSFVPIMNYSGGNDEDSGLDSAEDLNGDGQRDIVYYQGRDISIKYNVLSQAQGSNLGSAKAMYTGPKRIYTKTINSLLPATPRVQNFRVLGQNARQAIISLMPQTRGDSSLAKPSVYAIRFHRTPDAWLTDSLVSKDAVQNNYVEYYIYASPESSYTLDASRVPALSEELKVADQVKKEQLKSEELGTPVERVIVVKKASQMQAILSFQKSGVPYSTTIAPYNPETKAYGTFTTPILLHPQREQDTVSPNITLEKGAYMTVPTELKDGLEIKAYASDPSEIATMYWDKDTDSDSDKDGDATNDKDVVCSDPKNPAIASCKVSKTKNNTYVVNAPVFKISPFAADQVGKKFYMRLHAVDTVGNMAVQDLTIEPRTTNIVIDSYDSENGIVEGHIDPPSEGLELRVMRMKSETGSTTKNISELPLPQSIKTGVNGTFRIEGILAKESLGILGSTNVQVAEVTKAGKIQVNDTYEGKTLDVLVKQGSTYVRKLFSTTTLKTSTTVKSTDASLGSSFLTKQGDVPTDQVHLQVYDKNKVRLQVNGEVQTVQILQENEWKNLYEFTKKNDTLVMNEGSAYDADMIGGETIIKNGMYVSMLLITVEGVQAGLLSIPLGQDNQMFDVKGK